jgi:tetratricopeptide (TPR) repeat protein
MLQGKCGQCGATGALNTFKGVNDRLLCLRCTQQLAEQAKARKQSLKVASVLDPTLCYKCGMDNGSQELPRVGGLPFCMHCREGLYDRPFPNWLRLALVGLLALLAIALVHGKPFFQAGKDLVRSERLINARRYADAIPGLKATLAVAPDCEKCALLLAKADLLTGEALNAQQVLSSHRQGRFEKGVLTDEVQKIYHRAAQAFGKANQAAKLYKEKKWDDAARLMREAASLYPESPMLAEGADSAEGTAAFERKDYDGFVQVAERSLRARPNSPGSAGMLASALACKYAVSGDPAFQTRSEEMLTKARQLAASSPADLSREKEFEERTRYRLQSREIIEPVEYNRRFRKKANTP